MVRGVEKKWCGKEKESTITRAPPQNTKPPLAPLAPLGNLEYLELLEKPPLRHLIELRFYLH